MSTNTTRLDVVLPTHNVAPWLADCLDSLRAQVMTRWHAFVVIDASTDGSELIAQGYAERDNRISVIRSDRTGVGAARNTGFAMGSSDYVAFVDPDDVVPPLAFSTLIDSLDHSGSDLAAGHAEQVRDGEIRPYWTMSSGLFLSSAQRTNLAREPRLVLDHTTWNKVYRRRFLVDKDIRFPEDVAIGEDAHHTIQAICHAGAVDVVSTTVYRHRVRPRSLTGVIKSDKSIAEWVSVTRAIKSIVDQAAAPMAAGLWRTRMLEHEAWTRTRRTGAMDSDTLERFLTFLREVTFEMSPTDWASIPLLLRWGYDVLGVAPVQTAALAEPAGFAGEYSASMAELRDVTTLPEFERFERDLRLSGTTLRSHLWRESLLHPALRVLDAQTIGHKHRAIARVLSFHDAFVAAHTLLPGEDRLIELAREMRFAELAQWKTIDRQLHASATISTMSPGRIAFSATIETPSGIPTSARPIAISRGAIAGLVRAVESSPSPGKLPRVTGRVQNAKLRPFGQWSLGLEVIAGGAPHFVPLSVSSLRRNIIPTQLRTLVPVSAPAQPLVIETRAQVWVRVYLRLVRVPLVRNAGRRIMAAFRRVRQLTHRS